MHGDHPAHPNCQICARCLGVQIQVTRDQIGGDAHRVAGEGGALNVMPSGGTSCVASSASVDAG
jgi:hypothetical protein